MAEQNAGGPLIAAEGVSKGYREGGRWLQILDGLELQIAAGEQVALIGRSGAGKSTLLNLLGGIDRPEQGVIRLRGTAFSGLDERERTLFRRRHIGIVYQAFNLIPTLTAQENVALPLELNGTPARAAGEAAAEFLARVGLADRGGAYPEHLSGGEQQRVAIARALVHRPALVLADEPTGNLDAHNGQQVLELLTAGLAEGDHALLLVTHSREVAAQADRVLTLQAGQVVEIAQADAW